MVKALLVVLLLAVVATGCEKSEQPPATSKGAASSAAPGTPPTSPPAGTRSPAGAALAKAAGATPGEKASAPAPGAATPPEVATAGAPAWKAIADGKELRFAGVAAHVPGSWNVVPQGNATLVVPQGANQTLIEEIYGFIGEPTLKTLDTPGLEPYLDNAVMQLLQVPAQRAGPGEAAKVGALEGKTWKWTARLIDGRTAEVRAWAFVGSYAGSFVAIATPEVLARRMPEVESILGSVHRPTAAAIDAARLCTTWVRAFGGGTALIGNANEQRITFDASGRYHYHSEGTSHGVFHTGSSQTDISGSWRLVGDQLTGVSDSGETQTFTVEARTEAGTGAAVLAIDGTEFRQAEGRGW